MAGPTVPRIRDVQWAIRMTDEVQRTASLAMRGKLGPTVILASQSPRRMLLLPIVCRVVGTVSPDVDESPVLEEPSEQLAPRLAKAKLDRARSMLEVGPDNVSIVSADTVVSLEGIPFGKPTCESEARDMLTNLRGRSHTVITAVAIGQAGS